MPFTNMATLTIGKFFSYVFFSAYIFLMAEYLQPVVNDLFNDVPLEETLKKNATRERNRIYTLFFLNTIIGAVLLVTYITAMLIKIEELKQLKRNKNEKDIKLDSPGESDNQDT